MVSQDVWSQWEISSGHGHRSEEIRGAQVAAKLKGMEPEHENVTGDGQMDNRPAPVAAGCSRYQLSASSVGSLEHAYTRMVFLRLYHCTIVGL